MSKVARLLLSCGAMGLSLNVEAFYDSSPLCYRHLQMNFFDPVIVQQALSLQEVPQNTWQSIANSLIQRSKDVPYQIHRQADRMRPNPLKKPYDAKVAEKLLEDVLYQVFVEVLSQYNVKNMYRIREMFMYIKSQHNRAWSECLGNPVSSP